MGVYTSKKIRVVGVIELEGDYVGKTYGKLKVIGDTGKRSGSGEKILIARHIETGKIFESRRSSLENGTTTGFKSSKANVRNGQVGVKKTHEKTIRDGYGVSLLKSNNTNTLNKTGYKGIYFSNNYWVVEIRLKNKEEHIQRHFRSFKDAVLFSEKTRKKLILPLLSEGEKKTFSETEGKEVIINDYVAERQQEINKEVDELKKTEKKYQKTKGVTFRKDRNNWFARIKIDGKTKHLGTFPTEQEAIQARQKAVEEQIKILKQEMERL